MLEESISTTVKATHLVDRSISNSDRQSAKDFALVPIQCFPIIETQFLGRQHVRAEDMLRF